MPTNDERREVAKELRYTASHSLNGYSFQRAVEGIAFGALGDRPWRETLTRLADLIEPEPERTCRWKHIEGTWFMSECGKRYDCVMPDNYCPNCGAKVVE